MNTIKRTYGNGKIKISIELSDDLMELYNRAIENGRLEYRDSGYNTLEDYISNLPEELSENKRNELINSFKYRNEGGTLDDADLLCLVGLLRMDMNAWHLTYKPIKEGEIQ